MRYPIGKAIACCVLAVLTNPLIAVAQAPTAPSRAHLPAGDPPSERMVIGLASPTDHPRHVDCVAVAG